MTTASPFLGTEAVSAGLMTRRTLRSRHRKLFRNVYIDKDAALTPVDLAIAAWLFSGRTATLAGASAAALHQVKWLDPTAPPELIRADVGCPGLIVHRYALTDDEVCTVAGIPVTTPARTAFDIGRRSDSRKPRQKDNRKDFVRALVRLDALGNATGLQPADVHDLVKRHRGARGLVQLGRVLEVTDGGAESPQETRTRLALLDGGLRRPQTQIVVRDEGDYPFARIDMGYEEFKVGIEYDGEQHWTDPRRRNHDIERQVKLAEQGWIIIRVSADMLRDRRWLIVRRTKEALRARGCSWVDECGLELRPPRKSVA